MPMVLHDAPMAVRASRVRRDAVDEILREQPMNIKHRTRINPRMVERANNARRKARRAPIPAPRIEGDKRPAMIDRMVQQEMDDNDAHVQG
jgi:hypothetical protein